MRGNEMFQNLFKIGAGGGEQRPPKPANADEPDEVVEVPAEPEAPAA